MIKNAVTDAILSRRSTRAFTDEPLTKEELETLLEAGIWAPTARNLQKIYFVVLDKPELLKKLGDAFEKAGGNANFYYNAPALVLMYAGEGLTFGPVDCGIAAQTMSLAAESLGLGSIILGIIRGFLNDDPDGRALSAEFGAPAGSRFEIGVAAGHIKTPTPPRERKSDRIIRA